MTTPSIKEPYPGEFLRVIVGSTLNGISIGDSDRDEMGVCIEGPEKVIGLESFEQHTYRSVADGEKSHAGDLDLTVYGLRKFMRLAMKGNPSVLCLLFVPPEFRITDGILADELRSMTPHIVSRQAAGQYLGYLTAQKQRMLGERGGRNVNRPVNAEGMDTKYACHMIRLGLQGVELMTTGRLELPMTQENRDYCLAIRRSEVSMDEVLNRTGELEHELADLRDTAPLPEKPNAEVINEFLYETYTAQWKAQRS